MDPITSSNYNGENVKFNDHKNQQVGTLQCPFKLTIVGGGPSGCSIIIRAIRIGMCDELCGFTDSSNSHHHNGSNRTSDTLKMGGVCIIDKGNDKSFGGGKLQEYQINSNTWANKFVTNVIKDKLDVDPPETITGTVLESLKGMSNATDVEAYGNKNAPLSHVGAFLCDVGTVVRSQLSKYPDSSKCLTNTTVQSVYRIQNKQFTGWRIVSIDSSMMVTEYYSKYLVLCNGGKQNKPQFPNSYHNAKVMTSDHVCTDKGVQDLKAKLVRANKAKVVIVGGSHSAFSAAWICLNKIQFSNPSDDAALTDNTTQQQPTAASSPNRTTRMSQQNSATPTSKGAPMSVINDKDSGRLCFQQHSIVMLHRSNIDVFYSTKAEADDDKYAVEASQISKVTGQIHPFGGLRGDAKELWRSVKQYREQRIKLVQIKHPVATLNAAVSKDSANSITGNVTKQTIVDKLFDDATVIVWACGYSSNIIPVYDADGALIPFKLLRGQVEVDDSACILAEDSYVFAEVAVERSTSSSRLSNKGSRSDSMKDDFTVALAAVANEEDNKKTTSIDDVKCIPYNDVESTTVAAPTITLTSPSAKTSKSNSFTLSSPAVGAKGNSNILSASTKDTSSSCNKLGNSKVIPNLLGSGLGYGFIAKLENGELDGSSGRADGVAVYLKRGATLVLAKVLGNKVYGGNGMIKSWEERNSVLRKKQTIPPASALTVAVDDIGITSRDDSEGGNDLSKLSPVNRIRPHTSSHGSLTNSPLASPQGSSSKRNVSSLSRKHSSGHLLSITKNVGEKDVKKAPGPLSLDPSNTAAVTRLIQPKPVPNNRTNGKKVANGEKATNSQSNPASARDSASRSDSDSESKQLLRAKQYIQQNNYVTDAGVEEESIMSPLKNRTLSVTPPRSSSGSVKSQSTTTSSQLSSVSDGATTKSRTQSVTRHDHGIASNSSKLPVKLASTNNKLMSTSLNAPMTTLLNNCKGTKSIIISTLPVPSSLTMTQTTAILTGKLVKLDILPDIHCKTTNNNRSQSAVRSSAGSRGLMGSQLKIKDSSDTAGSWLKQHSSNKNIIQHTVASPPKSSTTSSVPLNRNNSSTNTAANSSSLESIHNLSEFNNIVIVKPNLNK